MFVINKGALLLPLACMSSSIFAHSDLSSIEVISVLGNRTVTASNSSAMKIEISQLETPGSIVVYDKSLLEAQGGNLWERH
ncbi:hypothetical protein [Shewanella woodyi]|uniref:hypothetical protein n=1 Tax=Shewanella woodyi TaxID=60961 RepID=UPI003749BFAB